MSKIDLKNVDFETLIIHAGQEPDKAYGSLATPIYQTSTFCFETVEEGAAKFANQIPGFVYSRGGNPTTRAFELKCAAMEGGEDAVAAASGMGAVGSVMTAFLHPGDHAIFDTAVYGGTNYVATTNLPGMGVEVSRVDTGDLEAVKAAGKQDDIIVTGIDAIEDALDSIKAGELAATCFQDAIGQGQTAIEMAMKAINGESIERTNIPFELVTIDNVDEYYDRIKLPE